MKHYVSYLWLPLAIAAVLAFTEFSKSHEDKARDFLDSLTKTQLVKAQKEFDDPGRLDWSYLPGTMLPRQGIALEELNRKQTELLHTLLESYLSESGYRTALEVIALEGILHKLENENPMRDEGKYFVVFYGEPLEDDIWAWSFEGHHLSYHFTIVGEKISMAPRFIGASPAEVMSGPEAGLRVLGQEEDLGLELINSLSEEQKSRAIFSKYAYTDIVTSTSTEVGPLGKAGIAYATLLPPQQEMLRELIIQYLSAMPGELAVTRMGSIREENLDKIHFGWAGSTKRHQPHYYRVQGESFLIEFDNVQNDANHIHTVWRDFDGDFGRDLLREHYTRDH